MFNSIPSILNKSRTMMARRFGSETQSIISQMLFNDDINVLTTFDMNRIASYTFGETICGEIFDVVEHTLRNPLEFTVLSLHKCLVLMHHLAVYASQKAANNVWILKPLIEPLLEYNTVLMAMNDPKSLMAKVQRIMGGSVDRGMPVRESAKVLWDLLSDVEMFKKVRETSADPDSLVPVGHREHVGFVSDEVRKATLEEQLKNKNKIKIKSSLKDGGAGGFGSGNGTVVGAAHSMEEMLKMAMQNQRGYKDGDLSEEEKEHMEHLQQLQRELQEKKAMGVGEDGSGGEYSDPTSAQAPAPAPVVVDLLDFGNDPEPAPVQSTLGDLPYTVANEEPFILPTPESIVNTADTTADPFAPVASTTVNDTHSAGENDPFAPVQTPVSSIQNTGTSETNTKSDGMDLLSMTMGSMAVSNDKMTQGAMTNNDARSAFDSITTNVSENIMGGSAANPIHSAFDSIPSSSASENVMGGSSNLKSLDATSGDIMGGSASIPPKSIGIDFPHIPNMAPPMLPSNDPPTPPTPPTEAPPLPPSEPALNDTSANDTSGMYMPSNMPSPMGGMGMPSPLMGGSSSDMNNLSQMNNPMGMMNNQMMNNNNGMNNNNMNNNGMNNNGMNNNGMNNNGMNNNGMMNSSMMNNPMMMMMMNNPMAMNNPMMMQAMQNATPDQQNQMFQQMMMMNQQMMAQFMQMQNQNSTNGSSNNNMGSSNNNSNNNTSVGMGSVGNPYPSNLNPFQ